MFYIKAVEILEARVAFIMSYALFAQIIRSLVAHCSHNDDDHHNNSPTEEPYPNSCYRPTLCMIAAPQAVVIT